MPENRVMARFAAARNRKLKKITVSVLTGHNRFGNVLCNAPQTPATRRGAKGRQEMGQQAWKCNELLDGWCWLRSDGQARITAYYRSPDDLTLETRPEGERHFEVAGKFGSLTSAMRAAQGVLS